MLLPFYININLITHLSLQLGASLTNKLSMVNKTIFWCVMLGLQSLKLR